ncbi:MAG: hypothetical protein L0207_03980 [Chlamydiae bacterium]|nr:hypothetical protein [Chlamydiota bacterium]
MKLVSLLLFLLFSSNLFSDLESVFPLYSQEEKTFFHNGKSYTTVLEDFSSKKIACIGRFPLSREILLLNPDSSVLNGVYSDFISGLKKNLTLEELFTSLSLYLHSQIFDLKNCDEKSLKRFFQNWYSNPNRTIKDFTIAKDHSYLPVLYLDEFILAKTGVCRHFTLTAAYLLDRMVKEGKLSGKVDFTRGEIILLGKPSKHSWITFISDETSAIWRCDFTLNLIRDCP